MQQNTDMPAEVYIHYDQVGFILIGMTHCTQVNNVVNHVNGIKTKIR